MKLYSLMFFYFALGSLYGQSYEIGLAMHRFSKLGDVKNGLTFDSDFGIDIWMASTNFISSNLKWLIGYRYSTGYIEKIRSDRYSSRIVEGSDFSKNSVYINALTTFCPFQALELNAGAEVVVRISEKRNKAIIDPLTNALGFGVMARVSYNLPIWPGYGVGPIYTFHMGIVDEITTLNQTTSRHTFGLRLVKNLKDDKP